MTPATILYDPDCGFCRVLLALLLRWDTHGRLRPVALGSEEADYLLAGMAEDERMASWHLVEPGAGRPAGASGTTGALYSAGAAFPPIFGLLPGGRPLAELTARFPRASERGYRWAADHRSLLGRRIPAAARRWADRVVAERALSGRPHGSGSRPDRR